MQGADSLVPGAVCGGLFFLCLLVVMMLRTNWRTQHGQRQHELTLLQLGAAKGRQEVLDDVRMLEHGQLKTHVLAVQRCLSIARNAASVEQRDRWIDEGLSQADRLLKVVVMLHQAAGASALPSDLERTVVDVAQSLAVAYPDCGCQVEVSGQRIDPIGESIKRALMLVLYNALIYAYVHGCPAHVMVQLQYAPDALLLVVRNDGRGMPPCESRQSGRGLRDMRDLVAQHGGSLIITSEPEAGTEVRVSLPIGEIASRRSSLCSAGTMRIP